MTGWQACVSAIKTAAGVELSDKDVEAILDDILARKTETAARLGLAGDAAAQEAARQAADDARMAAAIEQRNALVNARARLERRSRIEETAAAAAKPGKPLDFRAALQAEIHGINTPVRGGRASAEAEWRSRAAEYLGKVTSQLERAGLLSVVKSGALEREWARELFELSKGAEGNPGITGSKEALAIASIFHAQQDAAKANLNRAGAWIGDYAGYITRTSHDADRIRAMGFEAWRDLIVPKLDPKTFYGIDDFLTGPPERFLRSVYEALVTGIHMTAEGMAGFKDPAFKGPANLAKKLSQDRLLHFRDADSWLDYNDKAGIGTPAEGVLHSLERAGRDEAVMRRWGTNSRAEFQQDLKYLGEQYRGTDTAAVLKLRDATQGLQNRFDHLDGTAGMPANQLGAKLGSAARVWTSMAKLGMVAFTHLSVATTKAAELRYQGVGLFQGYSDVLTSLFRGRGQGETRELADLLQAGTEGMSRDIVSRFEPDDTMPGTLSKLANTFFKWNGLTYLLNAQKTGAQFTMARQLGRLVDRDFDGLPKETQRAFLQYDISPAEWDILRNAPGHKEIDGRTFLSPDAAQRSGLLEGDAANRLALKLHTYFSDVADRSVITPGIAEKALFLGGNRPGTLAGEALRFIAQFKTWPAAAVRQGLGREIYGSDSKMAAFAGVMHLAVGASITGYVVMTLKDLLKGKNPRPPDRIETWAAAMMQGGGIGILGDYLFGEYSRFGNNVAETLLGPVLGAGVSSVVDIWNRFKAKAEAMADGEAPPKADIAPELFRTALNNTPFINMFYTRLAMDYMFLWHIQEAMSPGYLRRFERRVQQQNHQTFWLRPSEAGR